MSFHILLACRVSAHKFTDSHGLPLQITFFLYLATIKILYLLLIFVILCIGEGLFVLIQRMFYYLRGFWVQGLPIFGKFSAITLNKLFSSFSLSSPSKIPIIPIFHSLMEYYSSVGFLHFY